MSIFMREYNMEVSQEQSASIIEPMVSRTLKVSGDKILSISKALKSRTRQRILTVLKEKPSDVSQIAARLNQTEANISAQIKHLQSVGLVSSRYEAGKHGVRKICKVIVDKVIILLD
ncbi:MAG: ArsR/SmtB family transcription factor [Promethearchaeota archaeon]